MCQRQGWQSQKLVLLGHKGLNGTFALVVAIVDVLVVQAGLATRLYHLRSYDTPTKPKYRFIDQPKEAIVSRMESFGDPSLLVGVQIKLLAPFAQLDQIASTLKLRLLPSRMEQLSRQPDRHDNINPTQHLDEIVIYDRSATAHTQIMRTKSCSARI